MHSWLSWVVLNVIDFLMPRGASVEGIILDQLAEIVPYICRFVKVNIASLVLFLFLNPEIFWKLVFYFLHRNIYRNSPFHLQKYKYIKIILLCGRVLVATPKLFYDKENNTTLLYFFLHQMKIIYGGYFGGLNFTRVFDSCVRVDACIPFLNL